jgi:two-component system sensor kinase FixL
MRADGTTILRNATLATSEIGGRRYFTAVITPPRESETVSLVEQERRVLNEMLVPSIVIDSKGVVQVFNPAATSAFGFELAEVIGKNISMLMADDIKAQHDGYLSKYEETGDSKIIGKEGRGHVLIKRFLGVGRAVHVKAKDGSMIPCKLFINRKSDGKNTFFTGMLQLKS